jgi:hypothetical protein
MSDNMLVFTVLFSYLTIGLILSVLAEIEKFIKSKDEKEISIYRIIIPEERGLDVVDSPFFVILGWPFILISAIIFGVVFGVYFIYEHTLGKYVIPHLQFKLVKNGKIKIVKGGVK